MVDVRPRGRLNKCLDACHITLLEGVPKDDTWEAPMDGHAPVPVDPHASQTGWQLEYTQTITAFCSSSPQDVLPHQQEASSKQVERPVERRMLWPGSEPFPIAMEQRLYSSGVDPKTAASLLLRRPHSCERLFGPSKLPKGAGARPYAALVLPLLIDTVVSEPNFLKRGTLPVSSQRGQSQWPAFKQMPGSYKNNVHRAAEGTGWRALSEGCCAH